jgi:hypothetical protein
MRCESAPLPPGQHTGYHHRVVTLNHVLVGVVSGSILIVFGVVPGLFQELREFVRNFCDSLSSPFPIPSRRHDQTRQPTWLAGLGLALIAATVAAYLSARI